MASLEKTMAAASLHEPASTDPVTPVANRFAEEPNSSSTSGDTSPATRAATLRLMSDLRLGLLT
jgi:hypothetical protein